MKYQEMENNGEHIMVISGTIEGEGGGMGVHCQKSDQDIWKNLLSISWRWLGFGITLNGLYVLLK